MKLKTFLFMVIAMLTIAFTSCSNEAKDLSGKWIIYSFEVNGEKQQLVVSDITFEKQSDNSYSVNGYSGVNSYFGDVTISGTKIKPGTNFGSTKMAGDPASMTFEDNFLKCLTGATSAKLTNEDDTEFLEIKNDKDNSVLVFFRK